MQNIEKLLDIKSFIETLKQFSHILNTQFYLYRYSKEKKQLVKTSYCEDFRPKIDLCKNENYGFCNIKIEKEDEFNLVNYHNNLTFNDIQNNSKYRKLKFSKCELKFYKIAKESFDKCKLIKQSCSIGKNTIYAYPLYVKDNDVKRSIGVVVIEFVNKNNLYDYYDILDPFKIGEVKMRKILKNIRKDMITNKEMDHYKRLLNGIIDSFNREISLNSSLL